MSVKSWMQEFYTAPHGEMTKEEALLQSLDKFIGARPENLEKHSVSIDDGVIFDENHKFVFGAFECGLCVKYRLCGTCPIFGESGKRCGTDDSEYDKFRKLNDPEPMIKMLKQILWRYWGK